MNLDVLTEELEHLFKKVGSNDDASHDIYHSRRVKAAALTIADYEGGADRSVLIAAAYFHDIVNVPKNSPDRANASVLSAQAAASALRTIGLDEPMIDATCHAIVAHSFSANVEPQTLEAKIFQDADRLEALGAIGAARAFFIAGKLGNQLFDGDDPFARKRPLDDRSFALDHFALKLLRLPSTMRTRGGRTLAERRLVTIHNFLTALGAELGTSCPWL